MTLQAQQTDPGLIHFKADPDFKHCCANCGFGIEDHPIQYNRHCPWRCMLCGEWSFDCRCPG